MPREDSHFRLRLPEAERAFIKREAEKNSRSMTGEIIQAIRARMPQAASGGNHAAVMSAAEAATGDEIAVQAPAAADHTAALQGGSISTQAFEVPR